MRKTSRFIIVLAASLASLSAMATPPNTIVMDGRPVEYDDVDLRASTTNKSNTFGAGNMITNLFVTWDADYLYVAVQGEESGNKLAVMVDADPGSGTGANTTTNWTDGTTNTPDYIRFNDPGWTASSATSATPFGLDYMFASEGFFNNAIRINYDGTAQPNTGNTDSLFDSGNGSTPSGGPVDVVATEDDSINDLEGFEARIAWSNFYIASGRFGTVQPGHVVPTGAVIRVFALLHNNRADASESTDGILPNQTSVNASYTAFPDFKWITDDYIDIVLDADADGLPDLLPGDVNAPYLNYISGVQSQFSVYARFNEPVEQTSAENPANWIVNGFAPQSVSLVQSNGVILSLTNALPGAGTLVRVSASGVEDADSNAKTTYNYFDPAANGISTSLTVRFLLNKNSGMGRSAANPRVTTNLFINGSLAPLEFGFPPAMNTPLVMLNTTQYYADVTFLPGTSTELSYKYSGILDGGALATGTNNYEAVRLIDFANASRKLTLPTDGTPLLVVTDWLGAAAAPFNDPATNGYEQLYFDLDRGAAGVRQRTEILFTLDLSQRNLQGVTRVLVMGSDPLRGFNNAADFWPADFKDFPGSEVDLTYENAGLTMNDAGVDGDATAGDGIYSLLWAATADGLDSTLVPNPGNSLVGGDFSQTPYFGFWLDARSPRSFIYKFYVYNGNTGQALESPSSDIEFYIEDPGSTNIVLDTFLWDNAVLPLPPPSNAPTMLDVSYAAGSGTAVFTNDQTELQHGWQVSSDLIAGWEDYGGRAVTSLVSGIWTFTATEATDSEHYRAFAGPPKPFEPWYWEPNVLDPTGGVVRYWYNQHSSKFAGRRNIGVTGSFSGWGNAAPATFAGDGWWYYDLTLTTNDAQITAFKTRLQSGDYEDGDNNYVTRGFVRASWTPLAPTNGELFTITYDANGGVLAAATNVRAYVGFGPNWAFDANRPMTNVLSETNVWEVSFIVPTNIATSINFVFNNGTTWDSKDQPGGLNWRVFLKRDE